MNFRHRNSLRRNIRHLNGCCYFHLSIRRLSGCCCWMLSSFRWNVLLNWMKLSSFFRMKSSLKQNFLWQSLKNGKLLYGRMSLWTSCKRCLRCRMNGSLRFLCWKELSCSQLRYFLYL